MLILQFGSPGLQNDGIISSTNHLLLGKEITIYPNPANTMLNVVSDLEGSFEIEIYDIIGKRMNLVEVNSRNVNVSKLPVGIYTLRISMEEAFVTRKIAIQR